MTKLRSAFWNVLYPSLTTFSLLSLCFFASLYQIIFLCKLFKYNSSSRLSPQLSFSSFCVLLKNFLSLHDVTQGLCAKDFHRCINNLELLFWASDLGIYTRPWFLHLYSAPFTLSLPKPERKTLSPSLWFCYTCPLPAFCSCWIQSSLLKTQIWFCQTQA